MLDRRIPDRPLTITVKKFGQIYQPAEASRADGVTHPPKTGPKETRVILGRTVLERRRDDAEELPTSVGVWIL
jgi:hypothetical protein